jgi:hypothetical protein
MLYTLAHMRFRWAPVVKWIRRTLLSTLTVGAAYLLILIHPQPLFAYELEHAGIVVHATRPIPDAMRLTIDRVRARLDRSPLADPAHVNHVFLCDSPWLFGLFARGNYRVGGIANVFVGQHVFLRASDMEHDRLIGPSGQPVAADRPLSYFIAHELMHIAHGRRLGRLGYARLPKWVDDGHADYVARDVDLANALRGFKEGVRELDPSRSGLYIRYHLMVAYVLEKERGTPAALLAHPPAMDDVERRLAALEAW